MLFPLENSIDFDPIQGVREIRYGRKIENDYFMGDLTTILKSEKIVFEMRILQKVMKLQLLVVGKPAECSVLFHFPGQPPR
jgi:hypothetical protein